MLAHKVHRGQVELAFASITRLLVIKVNCRLFHFGDLALAILDLCHLFIQFSIVLIDALLLVLQVLKHEGLQNAKT